MNEAVSMSRIHVDRPDGRVYGSPIEQSSPGPSITIDMS